LYGCDCSGAINAGKAIAGDGEVELVGLVKADSEQPLSASASQARLVRQTLRELTDGDRIHSAGRVRASTQPVEELLDAIGDNEPDLLILEWPCHFQVLETTMEELLGRIPCDLAVVRGPVPERPRSVLVALRGGPYAELSLRLSLTIARNTQAKVTSLHVSPKSSTTVHEAPFRGLSKVLRQLPEVNLLERQTDHPAEVLLESSEFHDLVVLGVSGQSGEKVSALGPVAGRIMQDSPAAVMVVKTRRSMPEERSGEMMGKSAISVLVDKWFAENTFHAEEFADLEALLGMKRRQDVTISLALPALNEEVTVGDVIYTAKSALMDSLPLLDEIILMDSSSTDRTREIAAGLGIPVYIHQETLPQYGARRGKGEALWKSLYTTRGDIVVWIDTDIVNIHPRFVYGLLGPLLANPKIQFVKGFYRRPIKVGDRIQAGGGGRVTELTARPLLNLFYPELSGVIQPLSGEYGGRREALQRVPFSSGYGVEIGLLIDVLDRYGLNAIAQVDLLERVHHNQPLESLSKMSFAIIQTAIRKLEHRYGGHILEDVNKTMKLIRYEPGRFFLDIEEIAEQERPPIIELPEYQEVHCK
jgi:glucosyl-3-phosphoglycerate synthase